MLDDKCHRSKWKGATRNWLQMMQCAQLDDDDHECMFDIFHHQIESKKKQNFESFHSDHSYELKAILRQ